MLSGLTRHIVVQRNKWASLQRVKESWWHRSQERKDAVSGQEDGKHQADFRVGKREARGVEKEEEECRHPQRAKVKGHCP